jgi:hypothetical protein
MSCVVTQRKKRGEYPGVKDSLPDAGQDCYELTRQQADPSGWRILYSPMPPRQGDSTGGFHLRAGPDAVLRLRGPLLEVDQRGIILRRDSANAPAFAVGSPLPPIQAVLIGCINEGSDVKPASSTAVLTLRDLLFARRSGCFRIQVMPVENSSDSNLARLVVPTTGPYAGGNSWDTYTRWDLSYVPHGKKPSDGYDLHARPTDYGYSGIRSYLLTGGRISVTPEERRATRSDPLAEVCESDINAPCTR